MIQGRDFLLYVNDDPDNLIAICYSKSCSLSRERDTLLIINPSSQDEDYIPTMKRGTISADGVMELQETVNGVSILEWLEKGQKIGFKFARKGNGGLQISGKAIVVNFDLNASATDVVSYSFTGKICGPLTITKAPILAVVYLANAAGVQLPGCPTPYPVTLFWFDGTLIGAATNPDEVISVFNTYSAANGNWYMLESSVDGGCKFNMLISYNAPMQPTFIIAAQGADFAISSDQGADKAISPDQTIDNALTPIG